MAELTIKLGDTLVQTHQFNGDLLRVGRSRENDIVLENLSVSRYHVQIRYHQGQYVLFDMNSSNGTFLNGTRVTRRELLDGDRITIGKHVLLWHDASEQSTVIDEPPDAPASEQKIRPRQDPRAEAWVKVDSGRLQGREFKVIRFETSIGKAANNDIILTDDWLLAKKQAIILRKGNDEFEIEDLGGIRKVKVNGKPIESRQPLRTGDKLELGGTRLVFFSTAAEHRSAPAQIILKPQVTPAPGTKATYQADEHATVDPEVAPAAPLPKEDSLDLEELFEPAAQMPHQMALAANGPGEMQAPLQTATSNGNGRYAGAAASAVQTAPAPEETSLQAQAEDASPAAGRFSEINPNVNDKEIEMWESALTNPSPAIRRQAARMLKKLTGRDYGV
jgi:pSer/pThr/pTyr-binding forkhead associated (FHA) protein